MSLVRWKAVALHCTSQGIPDGLPRPRWPRRSDWLPLPRKISRPKHGFRSIRAGVALTPSPDDVQDKEVLFSQTLPLKRSNKVEGKITIRLDQAEAEKNGSKWRLTVGCNLDGKWTLHWGVNYCDEIGSDWDQPPPEMRPPGSVSIKDYAIETPLRKVPSTLEGQILHEVHIEFDSNTPIAAIHFVLKEEETGSWFQHKGRDFEISFINYNEEDNVIGGKQGLGKWSGALNQISNLLLKADGSTFTQEDAAIKDRNMVKQKRQIAHFYEEFPIVKEEFFPNYMTVSVRRSNDADKKFVKFETDLPGDVIVHWGVCKDDGGKWEVPPTPHPPATTVFRHRALQTLLQIGCMRVHQHLGYVPYGIYGRKDEKYNESRCNRFHPCIFYLFYCGLHPTPNADGLGSWGVFLVDKETSGLVFVLKLNECTWLNNMGSDFYVPIESDILPLESESLEASDPENRSLPMKVSEEMEEAAPYTEEIISEIRSLVTGISSEKSKPTTTKETQENILQEIEKLAAEAYSIFRTSPGSAPAPDDESKPSVKVCSGTGSGHEILCQGFNWESQKSGRWYAELSEKTKQLSSLGFTVVWLPPPTASVSPEGYMPTDLYNLSSRYGNIEELKGLVNKFHEAGIKVLGDVVLNHRCAHYQNKNGVWNIFGGRLNWDDRAVVGDDPHFQGRGNKSSGDNFHAAPNIDHSQDFVRRDIKGWLNWLRQEVGYDGWRLDFVRGFWGGYVKDYLEASEPYFAVGEFWDSLSYTYGEMDHNQDAHRQRIVDWINATNGYAGAFDVTTKGILHSALERCEYWRLSDQNGKPPGVVGWWPSRAVTFIENHDTGSTQGHWRFPSGKEMQGYAYILTHPGTPSVFYDHIFSHYQQEISKLISLRGKNQIHCRSTVKIIKAERDHYAAEIDEKVVLKIGPGHFEPHNGHKNWVLAAEGQDYKVWETS